MKDNRKDVFTIQIERMDEYGEYEVVDEMKYAKTYYSFDDAIEDGKKAYDEYSAIEDTPIAVCIMGGEYEMPDGDIYGEPECLETIRSENRDKFDESTKKLNVTKERFEKSRYFTKKYGKLKYVSESGKIFKTDKGLVLEFTDGYEGLSADGRRGSFIDGHQDDPLYGTQGYCGNEPDVDWEADREEYKRSQIKGGVILRRTNKIGDLWRIETVDSGIRLEENIRGLKKAEKLAKKNGWKIVKIIPKNPEMAKESQEADKAHTCPRCGFTGCSVDGLDILKGDCKEGGTFDANFYCDQCGGTYNVTFGLSIQDIYDTSNDENLEIDLPDSELEDDDL